MAFIGVAREGVETALFLFASTGESGAVVTMIGGIAGLVAAVVLGTLFYRGALRMNLSRFFLVTSVLVIAFAAYLIFSGIHEFGEVAGSEALELAAPLAALLYGAGFALLYLRDSRRPAASPPPSRRPRPRAPARSQPGLTRRATLGRVSDPASRSKGADVVLDHPRSRSSASKRSRRASSGRW